MSRTRCVSSRKRFLGGRPASSVSQTVLQAVWYSQHEGVFAMDPTLPIAMPRGMSLSTKRREHVVADATLIAATIVLAFLSKARPHADDSLVA